MMPLGMAMRAMMVPMRAMPVRAGPMRTRMHIDLTAAILPIRRVVSLLVYTEHALDAADDATDRAANNRADRTRHAGAFIESMGDATRHTLGLRCDRSRQRREQCARKQNPQLHCYALLWLVEPAHTDSKTAIKRPAYVRPQATRKVWHI
jgi:hypothetical protein